MRAQLRQYVELLFAGAPDSDDIKQEILQNTLDRYDDLIAAGKVPEAAYRIAISGIGDINEILGTKPRSPSSPVFVKPEDEDTLAKKLLRTAAVALYILSPIPLFLLSDLGMDTIGLCGTLGIVAVATVLIMLGAKKETREEKQEEVRTPENALRKSIDQLIWAVGLVLYFVISFVTSAWYITWVMFPLIGAVQGLVKAIFDLKEANKQ